MFATFFRLVDGTQQHPGIAYKVRIAPKLVGQQPGKAAKVVACGGHHGQGSMDFVRTHKKLVLVGNNAAMNFFRQLSERNLPGNFEQRQRSEEHTSELQSLMRISYAVFCLKKKKIQAHTN